MLLLQDALGLLRRPRATLARIDGRRGGGHGLTGIWLSATLPALVAELAALGPYSGPSGLGAPPREIRLLSEAFFRWLYQERFLLPLVDMLLGAALWLLAVALIHWVARRLGGRGSLSGYLGLCGPIAAIGALAVPVSLVEAGLRAAGQTAVARSDYLQACLDFDTAKTNDPDNRPEIQQALDQALARCLTPAPQPTSPPAAAPQRTLVVATLAAGVGTALVSTPTPATGTSAYPASRIHCAASRPPTSSSARSTVRSTPAWSVV